MRASDWYLGLTMLITLATSILFELRLYAAASTCIFVSFLLIVFTWLAAREEKL